MNQSVKDRFNRSPVWEDLTYYDPVNPNDYLSVEEEFITEIDELTVVTILPRRG